MTLSRPQLNAIIISYATLVLYGFLDNVRGPILSDIITFFNMSHFQGSLFFSITSAFFMVGAIVAPSMFHYRGYRRTFMEQTVLLMISQLIFAMANEKVWFLSGCLFMGFAVGVLSVMQNVLVLEASPSHLASRFINGLHANYAFASFLAPLVVSLIYRNQWSFKMIFFVNAIFSLLVFLLIVAAKPIYQPTKIANPGLRRNLSFKYLPFALLLSCYVAGEVLVTSRLSQFLYQYHGLTKENASDALSALFLLLLVGRLAFSFWALNKSIIGWIRILLFLSILCVVLGLYVSYWFFIILGLVMSPLYALMMLQARKTYGDQIDQAASLGIFVSGVMIIFMNSLVGWISDYWGIFWALLVSCVFFLISYVIFEWKLAKYDSA